MMNFLMIGESAVIAKCISESDPDSVIYSASKRQCG